MLGVLAVVFVAYFKLHPYKNTVLYYANFISFVSGQKNLSSYELFFDRNTLRDQHISQYLRAHTQKNDTVFLWGNSAQVYALTKTLPPGRYTVAYHISNKQAITETRQSLEKNPPLYIALFPDQHNFPFVFGGYDYKVTIDGIDVYEKRAQ